ncbi:hypothetical protein [Morganella psychrotolerans]|uniref:hypothetical protein n=1 Tax=Morganella psychrotolerans TaxID=368603 RepID=UPI0039B0030A
MEVRKILTALNTLTNNLGKLTNELPSVSKKVSAIASNLAGYSVVNGLICLIAVKASCKYPEFYNLFYNSSGVFIAILFFFFINDVFNNYFTIKSIKNKKLNAMTFVIYICIIFGSIFITWLYVAAIYLPLFTMPSIILECKL